jgi:uncharacterized protein DUF5681
MRTAQSIETSEERKQQTNGKTVRLTKDGKPDGRGKHPNSHTDVGMRFKTPQLNPNKWKPGQSGNPSGRPKHDVAREIAKAVFENNKEKLYKAYAKAALRGNAYAFSQLADRAYGKLKERVEYEISEYREVSEKALIERITELERELGLAAAIDEAGGAASHQAGTLLPPGPQED